MYNPQKAAQAAATFISLAPGERIDRVRLLKLLYLADRTSFSRYGYTITGDRFAALDYGPIPSMTYDAMKGVGEGATAWNEWIRQGATINENRLADGAYPERAGALSDADLEVIHEIWAEVGELDNWDTVEWTHARCPEWSHPGGSSRPITLLDMGQGLEIPADELEELLAANTEQDDLRRILSSL